MGRTKALSRMRMLMTCWTLQPHFLSASIRNRPADDTYQLYGEAEENQRGCQRCGSRESRSRALAEGRRVITSRR